jgi:hypothetical protein
MEGSIRTLGHNADSIVPFPTAAQARTLAPAWDLEMGFYDSLMTSADSIVFYNFSQQMATTDCEIWQQYLEMLNNAEIDSAQYYLGLMEATNNLDYNNVSCAEAFLETFAWYNPFLSTTEQTLEHLAYQTPYIAGRAVYSARVMLGIDNLDYGILYKQDALNENQEDVFELWPNPALNNVQLVFGAEYNGLLELNVRDLSGRLVSTQSSIIRSTYYSIDLSGIVSGVYFVEVSLNGASVGVQRLIKQ